MSTVPPSRRWATGLLGLVLAAFPGITTSRAFETPAAERSRLLGLAGEASRLFKQTGEGRPDVLQKIARRLEALADGAALPLDLRKELRQSAARLREKATSASASPVVADPYLELLARVHAHLAPRDLTFEGSFTQPKVAEPAYGGHASAMGPPPLQVQPSEDSASGAASPVRFEEVSGLETKTWCGGPTKDHILESGGSGVALFDYDSDGLLDLYLVTAFELNDRRERIAHRNALYHNLGHLRFEEVSARAGVDAAAWGNGVCAGDFDDDGRLDLYVTNWGPNLLYRNNGDGIFSEVAAKAGVQAGGWSTGCTFFDADGDGDLDLYVVRYVRTSWEELVKAERTLFWRGGPKVMVGPKGLPGEADLFFENRGDGTFAEATEAHGLTDAGRAYGFGVVATDYDHDGATDLFVVNDTNPNLLYHNRGDGRFESVGLLSGVAVNAEGRAQAGMGVDAGDYDGDGWLDFVVTTFAHDTTTLFRNMEGAQFEDATTPSGLAARTFERMGWGAAFFDADLDGQLDLFFANGHIYPNVEEFKALHETYGQKNQLLLNEGGRFRDVSESAGPGLQVRKSSRGLAVGDLDGDGDVDVLVSNVDDVPTLLENEQATGHHWVAFRLDKPGRNRFAIGARVTIDAGGHRQMREVRSGGSYLSQSDLRPCFGLGAYAGTVDVEVRLGAGAFWRWTGLASDRLHVLALRDQERGVL